ncbi:MAG TPA: serine/threonine-protein kinase [Myxococcales bacterium]|nr:serine/threonine-protein kinase [Myxococcales bacterium]
MSESALQNAAPFGKYTLLKRLAVGGMAELFLAQDTERGEQVVIKRILPYLSHEGEFVQMFLDEARIAAQLHHPSIIQIHELGKLNESLFMAMEYVNGVDLRKILQEEVKLGLTVPYGIVAYVTAQVCSGLHYAHNSPGVDGKPLGVIHRDVSPQNVMVSFDGRVKLVDFGIAKASALVERSKPGVIKGKFLYLSPEQLSQEKLDHRADLFAIGTMMYELATGKSPFYKSTTEAVIYAIRAEDPPPPELVRNDFPPELSRIVMKCLVKDRARRYQQGSEIQRDLEAFVRSAFPTDTQDLSSYITQLFASDGSSGEKRAVPPPAPPVPTPHTTPPPPGSGGGRKEATVPLPQAGKAPQSVLIPGPKRTTGDRDVPVPSDAAPTAHASPEEVARAQQLAAVRSGIMAALPHRKSMRHELGNKRRGTVTMRGRSSDRNEVSGEGLGKATPSKPAMGALAPPPMGSSTDSGPTRDPRDLRDSNDSNDSNESQSFTNPEADPFEAPPSDPGDNKMTEALPAPPVKRRRTPIQPPNVSQDTEANDPDDEEGGETASILPGQMAALAPRRPPPAPAPRSRHPMLVAGISFAVVLVLGIILLLVLRARAAQAPPALAPSGEAPARGAPARELASAVPAAAAPVPAPAPSPPAAVPAPGGPMRVNVRFDAPSGTLIQQDGQRFAPGLTVRLLPGPFSFEYRCPGRSVPISITFNVQEGRQDTQVIPIRCGLGR